MTMEYGFWRTKPLAELSNDEWEALCDGCGKCCLNKLQDDVSDEIYYTRVACKLLDVRHSRCSDYANRLNRVPDCVDLRSLPPEQYHWLPATCAYRLVAEGKDLPSWHYLQSGKRSLVHKATCTVRGRAISEESVHPDDLEDHIIRWVDR